MSRFKNETGQDRVLPTLGYGLVPDGGTFTVPDEEWAHWVAGGFTPLDPEPAPPEPETDPAEEAAPAAAPPAKQNVKTAAAAEGSETA